MLVSQKAHTLCFLMHLEAGSCIKLKFLQVTHRPVLYVEMPKGFERVRKKGWETRLMFTMAVVLFQSKAVVDSVGTLSEDW